MSHHDNSNVSGQALAIRNATESETFDLGGQSVSTIQNTIETAFSTPLPIEDTMIRITLVAGAGKQARQKYDDTTARVVTTALRDKCGYVEDRGASCVVECAGTYKLQHDTGKNLKTVIVFPKISSKQGGGRNDDPTGRTTTKPSLIPVDCPIHKIAMSSTATFERLLEAQCPSWSQKKGCLAALEHLQSMVDEIDSKLMKGVPLDDAEQSFYDDVIDLNSKISYTKDTIHKQVEHGQITQYEKDTLLQQNAERLQSIEKEINEKKTSSKQQQQKLETAKAKLTQRKGLLENIEPQSFHKLRHEQEIVKLWREVVPLLQLEEATKGRLLSVKETQSMARKDEIMTEIEALEVS
jgi:hypothetical protein